MYQKNARLFAVLSVFTVLIAALTIFFYFENANALMVEGVLIHSSTEEPRKAFSRLAQSPSFVVSPQLYEPVATIDQYMFNGAALFIQVLEGNRKSVVQAIRVYNPKNELQYCLTNYGDINKAVTLSIAECNKMLQSQKSTVVLIQFPDESQPTPAIELAGQRITIKPKSYRDIAHTSFLALRIMYKNSQDLIDTSNLIVGKVSG